jgi:hypothetical protein
MERSSTVKVPKGTTATVLTLAPCPAAKTRPDNPRSRIRAATISTYLLATVLPHLTKYVNIE